jgi:hypothetical protein
MDLSQTYWLEELKQNDKKLEKLDNIALELIKFYFLTLFSLTTIVFALYNYKIINTDKQWFFLIFLFPFILGVAVFITLRKIVTQYTQVETTRNQISEWFISGEVKNEFKIVGNTFSAFYTLLSWLVFINFLICIYFAFPFFRNGSKGLFSISLVIFAVIGIMGVLSSVVLASLNSARRKGRDASRKANLSNLRAVLEIFYDHNSNNYPIANNFNELLKALKPYLDVPLSDPLSKEGWSYEYNCENGKNYILKCKLEEGGEFIINSGEISQSK